MQFKSFALLEYIHNNLKTALHYEKQMALPGFLGHELLQPIIVVIASLYILFKSADLIIYGITNYAKKMGLSDAIIGLVVIAVAASSPEVISSLTGFLSGHEELGFAAIIGNNMVHMGLALGVLATVGKKITLEPNIFTKQRFAMWLALILPIILVFDGLLSRSDGLVLLTAFALYILHVWKIEGTIGKIKKNVKLKHIWRDALIFLGCLAALLLSGRWLVEGSVKIADYFALPEYIVGLTILGIGVTIPDFAIEIKSLFKKHANIGLGDLMGSLMVEMLLLLGLLALFKPLTINLAQAMNALIFLALTITIVMYWMNRKHLTWKHGVVLLSIYAAFMAIEIWKVL